MTLKFSDGIEIDTTGDFRVLHLPDGLYVVGHGFLCPVDSPEEAHALIDKLNLNRR